jgi:hypothetical protein
MPGSQAPTVIETDDADLRERRIAVARPLIKSNRFIAREIIGVLFFHR